MTTIGLLGGIGSGKSAVAELLRGLGARVHDADRASHEALRDSEARSDVLALLGPDVLDGNGQVDRDRVARRVFDDPAALQGLEAILHPRVRRRMEAWLAAGRAGGAPALVLDVPLLAETGLDRLCDLLVFVDAPRHLREERVRRERGWPPGEIDRREALQGDLEAKRRRAHAVIENTGDLERTRTQVQAFWQRHVHKGGDR